MYVYVCMSKLSGWLWIIKRGYENLPLMLIITKRERERERMKKRKYNFDTD